jgi:hypothetical protein
MDRVETTASAEFPDNASAASSPPAVTNLAGVVIGARVETGGSERSLDSSRETQ